MGVSLLPTTVVEVLAPGACVVEVGVGARWDTLEALSQVRPDLSLVATDVRADRLIGAPEGVEVVRDDVFEPQPEVYEGAALLCAVRCPAELQPPLAQLADRVGAALAVRAFKDEWADVGTVQGAYEILQAPDGSTWRFWPA